MFTHYFSRLREAVTERQDTELPSLSLMYFVVIAGTFAYIILAIILVPSNGLREYNFVNENGAATALSAIFLAVASAFSLVTMVTLLRREASHHWVWLVLAFGFLFLSFDELLQFHERAGRFIARAGSSGAFRNWNDVIVISYGIVAMPILAALLPGLMRSPKVLEMFAVGFAFYALHTLVDSISAPPTTVSIIVEESAKLMCGAFLAMGAFVGFVGVIWKPMDSVATSDDP